VSKKLKPLRYGPFEITKQVSGNDFKLNLPPHMRMHLVIGVNNLSFFEPYMMDGEVEEHMPMVECGHNFLEHGLGDS
jgi:hypothetical protein